jgi:hypothetical protein
VNYCRRKLGPRTWPRHAQCSSFQRPGANPRHGDNPSSEVRDRQFVQAASCCVNSTAYLSPSRALMRTESGTPTRCRLHPCTSGLPVVERVFRIRPRTDKKWSVGISAAVARTKIDRSVELGHPPYNRGPEAKRILWHPFYGAAILAGGDTRTITGKP